MTTGERLRNYMGDRQIDRGQLSMFVSRYWYAIAIVVVVGLAAGLRLWYLGERAIHHDESIHVKFAYDVSRNGISQYVHDPVYHGPLQYFGSAAIFKLPFFGSTDYTSRLLPALFGIALVGLPFMLRRQLGTKGALIAAAFLALSPTLLYFSRFARNDIYVAFFTLAIAVCIWRYVEDRRNGWLIAIAPLLALSFAAKEVTFITAAVLIVFLNYMIAADLVQQYRAAGKRSTAEIAIASAILFPTAWLAVALWPLIGGLRKPFSMNEMPAAGPLLIIVGTLAGPQFAPGIQALPGIENNGYFAEPDLMRGTVLVLVIASLYAGILWNWRIWLIAAGAFYGTFFLLFTSFFTNGGDIWNVYTIFTTQGGGFLQASGEFWKGQGGFWTGIWGSMDYWLDQQDVRRGNQPDYYYFILTPVYEFLPLVFAVGGMLYYAFRSKLDQIVVSAVAVALILTLTLIPDSTPLIGEFRIWAAFIVAIAAVLFLPMEQFAKFLLFWILAIFFALTVAGEKMPWLSTHIALPLGLFAAKVLNDVFSAVTNRKERAPVGPRAERRREAKEPGESQPRPSGGLRAEPLFLLLLAAGLGLLAGLIFMLAGPFSLPSILAWLAAVAAAGVIVWAGSTVSWPLAGQAATVALIGALLIFTVRASGFAAYDQGDLTFADPLDASEGGGTPEELLIYAQGSPDLNAIRDRIEDQAELSGAGKDLTIVIDNSADVNIWPWPWYLREFEFRGLTYDGFESGFEPQPNSVVLVSMKNDNEIEPFLDLATERIEYTHMWWFPEFYRGLDPAPFIGDVFQGDFLDTWRRYLIDREVANATSSPDRVAYFFGDFDVADIPVVERPLESKPIASDFWTAIGAAGTDEGSFQQPADIEIDSEGNLYVVDTLNHRIQIIAPDGSVITTFGEEGNGEGEFADPREQDENLALDGPWGIGLDAEGNIYVADTWNHRIQKFTSDGEYILEFGPPLQEGQPGLFGPRDVAIDADGNVLVADTGNKVIVKYTPDGEYIQSYGGAGSDAGQFNEPTSISVAPNGNIYIADFWNQRVQQFDPDFNYLSEFDVITWPRPAQSGVTDRAYIIALDDGTVIATDPTGEEVLVFGADGENIAAWTFDTVGTFSRPVGITTDGAGNVYISDGSTSQVIRVPLTALVPAVAPGATP